MPFTDTAECALHYVHLPSESGPDAEHVVLVHGLAASLFFWYVQVAPQLAKNFHVTLYDLRGHGRSRRPRLGYTAVAMSNDLRNLMDALSIERAHIIAHSFGGQIALHFARRFSDRVLTLTVADTQLSLMRHSGTHWEHGQKVQKILRERGLDFDIKDPFFGYRVLKEAARIQLSGDKEQMEAMREWIHPLMGRSGKRGARQWLQLLESTSAEQEIMKDDGITPELLGELRPPVLAIYGENSQAIGSGKRLVQSIPDAQFRVVPHAGHFFPASRPKMLIGAWSEFQERVPA
jgi:pimeloyl-ACP methyl ester carboxylesterase